jgi:protein involved in polysaccharide export with SLBB domain
MRKPLVLSLNVLATLFLASFMSFTAAAQGFPSSVDPSQGQAQQGFGSSSSADCTDPLMQNSSTCLGFGQQGTGIGQNLGDTGVGPGAGLGGGQGLGPGAGLGGFNPASPQGLGQSGFGGFLNPMSRTQNFDDTMANPNSPQNPNQQILSRRTLAPEPITDFQKFVAGTTGEMLPVFGANLFVNAPTTFAPIDQAPVPPDYVIGPGDELRIRAWGQLNFNANLEVDRSGDIYIPQVGPVHVAGLPIQVLDEHVRKAVSRVYRNFDLTVDIGKIRSVQVYIVGQAHRPGTYTISSLSTLVDALFSSGGPSIQGSLRHVYLKRGGKTIADFDLYDLLVDGDKSKDVKVESGDVIYIPAAGAQVALTGAIRRPGIYELRGDETALDQILKAAGGASTVAAQSRISIERIQDHRDRMAMEVAFDPTGLATPLHSGDIVRVLSIVPMYQKTVTLRGNTANPGRFAWHEGMRLSDLIPDRSSLLTRNYWWNRTRLGLPAPEFQPVPWLQAQSQPVNPVDLRERAKAFPLPQCTATLVSKNTPCQLADNTGTPQAGEPDELGSDPRAQLNAIQQHASTFQPSDQGRSTSSAVLENNSVSQTSVAAGAQKLTVKLPAPEIDWNYAVIERLDPETLKTSLVPFDLGKLVMEHDANQNLLLQPGDVISIFSQADIHVPLAQQTKFVRLEGEFLHAGTYSVQPGETLRDLVKRAGGLTPQAYLYGSEFTRESTRAIQQQRLDEYVRSLQLQIMRGSLAISASAAATPQDLISANASVATERELIDKLSQVRATGRVVLEVKEDSAGPDNVPELALEDGDRFIVPPVSASVNVVGSVYDQNSFLFASGRTVASYLHLAGGPNRNADRKHVFLIRADGSVVSRESANSVWGNNFEAVRVNPGDTLVVPEKTYGPTAARGFLEWSQFFSQMALGIAAVGILATN